MVTTIQTCVDCVIHVGTWCANVDAAPHAHSCSNIFITIITHLCNVCGRDDVVCQCEYFQKKSSLLIVVRFLSIRIRKGGGNRWVCVCTTSRESTIVWRHENRGRAGRRRQNTLTWKRRTRWWTSVLDKKSHGDFACFRRLALRSTITVARFFHTGAYHMILLPDFFLKMFVPQELLIRIVRVKVVVIPRTIQGPYKINWIRTSPVHSRQMHHATGSTPLIATASCAHGVSKPCSGPGASSKIKGACDSVRNMSRLAPYKARRRRRSRVAL